MATKIPTSCGCLIVMAFVAVIAVYTCSKMGDPGSRRAVESPGFEATWHEDVHVGISKALVEKSIGDCGQYKYKRDLGTPADAGEFRVRCTRDGETWVAYLVWPAIGEVTGPMALDPLLD